MITICRLQYRQKIGNPEVGTMLNGASRPAKFENIGVTTAHGATSRHFSCLTVGRIGQKIGGNRSLQLGITANNPVLLYGSGDRAR